VTAHLAELRAVHERTGAVAAFGDERAVADARNLDQAFAAGGATGPLHGPGTCGRRRPSTSC
jgi:Asp-tRNA(Asn)/Glu-tRNA(Gln) amidotransferase A subunit family amidase